MTDATLASLAEAAGVSVAWRDVHGRDHRVAPDTLRAVLAALDLPGGSDREIADSAAALRSQADAPALITAVTGARLELAGRWQLACEDGSRTDGTDVLVAPPPGYHALEWNGRQVTLASAPRACVALPPRSWGLAVQLYSLRRANDGGLGDFAALRDLVGNAASHGADAVAISPVHAQFSADPDRFSPYAPSSRSMLSVLHAPADLPDGATGDLVDWPGAARARLAQFRARFAAHEDAEAFAAWRAAQGEALEAHARFEAIHAVQFAEGRWHWRDWPAGLRDPASPDVARFAAAHADEVAFHAWLQFLADRALGACQQAARDAGMRIGLISDLAVGADGGGSQCWSRQQETLIGLSIGAPPDLLNTQGQAWGLTAFSPRGLRQSGYVAFIEMLRAALRHAGGVRIDHAMGLQRLWVLPDGGPAGAGAYLRYPVDDLLRLLALESHRHGAVVLGEDLGTLPDGFQERLTGAGIAGMRVLWFEQAQDGGFRSPRDWSRGAAAMTSTHDLATVAGWWRGTDLGWRGRLGMLGDAAAQAQAQQERERERARLWDAMRASGAAAGPPPDAQDPAPAVDAACAHVGRAACAFVLLPAEDALGLAEQPNLPGTLHEHPNWQRRLPGTAATLLDASDVAARLRAVADGRRGP